MNTDELLRHKSTFEEAGIRFVREADPNAGVRVGLILETVQDDRGAKWLAIGDSHVPHDLRPALRQVLEWVARRGG